MGRTVPPFSAALNDFVARVRKYGRALRTEDRRALDDLCEQARLNPQAAVYAAAPDPSESILLAMLIATWRRCHELETRVAALEQVCGVIPPPRISDAAEPLFQSLAEPLRDTNGPD
ncbi:MAG: hypothetical protein ACKV2V_21175 [Blastocatellia bacterium]